MFRFVLLPLLALLLLVAPAAHAAAPRIEPPSGRALTAGSGGVLSLPVRYRADGGRATVRVRLSGLRGATTLTRTFGAPPAAGRRVHRIAVRDADLIRVLGPGRVGRVRAQVSVGHRHAVGSGTTVERATRTVGAGVVAAPPAGTTIASYYSPDGQDDDAVPGVFVQWFGPNAYVTALYLSSTETDPAAGCGAGAVVQPDYDANGQPTAGLIDPTSLTVSAAETGVFTHAPYVGTVGVQLGGSFAPSGQTMSVSWTGGTWTAPNFQYVSCSIVAGGPVTLHAVPD